MKIALIFPPQWDPRQPPLCIPTLAGALKPKKHDVRAWDMNLALYRSILFQQSRSARSQRLIKQYLNPRTLSDHKKFGELSNEVENLIDKRYHPRDALSLNWDSHLDEGPSEDESRNWRRAIKRPNDFPFYRRVRPFIGEVAQWMPELVCISTNSDTQIFGGLSIASAIRSKLPQAKIIVGGQALRARHDLLLHHDWLFETIDGICISHGEPTLLSLAHRTPLPDVPNILWYDGMRVRRSKKIEPVRFTSTYQPDFSAIRLGQYLSPHIVVPVETARGCSWSRCSFCGHPGIELNFRNRYTPRPLSNVLREVQVHVSNGHSRFFFVDEDIPYDRFRALSTGLAKIKGNLSWICYLRSEHKHNISTFRLARRSGCLKVFIGLETGSKRLIRLHRKGTTPEITKRIILDANKAGIAVHLFIIVGFPDETEADRKATDELLQDVLPYIDQFGFTYDVFPLTAELGTPLYSNVKSFGGAGIEKPVTLDLCYEFSVNPSNPDEHIKYCKNETRINFVIKNHLKKHDGLHKLDSLDDSTHLLLIEGRLSTTRQKR
jgi:hypothetical protein